MSISSHTTINVALPKDITASEQAALTRFSVRHPEWSIYYINRHMPDRRVPVSLELNIEYGGLEDSCALFEEHLSDLSIDPTRWTASIEYQNEDDPFSNGACIDIFVKDGKIGTFKTSRIVYEEEAPWVEINIQPKDDNSAKARMETFNAKVKHITFIENLQDTPCPQCEKGMLKEDKFDTRVKKANPGFVYTHVFRCDSCSFTVEIDDALTRTNYPRVNVVSENN